MKTTILKTILCTGLFITSLSSTTFAETPSYTEEPDKVMEINLNIPSSYTWSVPSTVNFTGSESEKAFTVTIDDAVLSPQQNIKVKFNYSDAGYYDLNKGAFILKDEEVSSNTNQFFYKLYSNNDEELLRNEVFLQTNTANSTELKVKLLEEGNRSIAGNYKSRLKFISTIE